MREQQWGQTMKEKPHKSVFVSVQLEWNSKDNFNFLFLPLYTSMSISSVGALPIFANTAITASSSNSAASYSLTFH